MLFNSEKFIIFFTIVYILYIIFSKSKKSQNLLLLASSYVFYGAWDWRFLFLILISTCIDFLCRESAGSYRKDERSQIFCHRIHCLQSVDTRFLQVFQFFLWIFRKIVGPPGHGSGLRNSQYNFYQSESRSTLFRHSVTPSTSIDEESHTRAALSTLHFSCLFSPNWLPDPSRERVTSCRRFSDPER